jgi:hypothetical protein
VLIVLVAHGRGYVSRRAVSIGLVGDVLTAPGCP